MKMFLSDKDKKLLLILAIIAVFSLPYFFVIQPFIDKNDTLEEEIKTLNERKVYLEELALAEDEYINKTEEFLIEKERIINKFPSQLLQEASIIFINNTEKKIPIKLYQVTFGEDVASQITSDAEEEAIAAVEVETGDVTDNSVIVDNSTSIKISKDLSAIQTETQFTYEVGYKEFKDFLKYILNYKDRMVITGLNATYSQETDLVRGNFTMVQYAVEGKGRLPVSCLEPVIGIGSSNIFRQAAGISIQEDVEISDFFIMLSQPDADVDAKIIGMSGDVAQTTYLTSNENAMQEITISFSGENGFYKANYQIGNKEYDGEEIEFMKDGSINLEIICSPRTGDEDRVAAKINIRNNTDTTVNISVLDDDAVNPRVEIGEKTGTVLIK